MSHGLGQSHTSSFLAILCYLLRITVPSVLVLTALHDFTQLFTPYTYQSGLLGVTFKYDVMESFHYFLGLYNHLELSVVV